MRSFWNRCSNGTEHRSSSGRNALKPVLESIEDRFLLSAGVHGHVASAAHNQAPAEVAAAQQNALAPYRVFVGSITKGPAAGKVTLVGPLVVGETGRIQFAGFLFEKGGPIVSVFGTQTGGGVAMTFEVPTGKHSIERVLAFGSGQFQGVKGGLPGGMSLIGSGNLEGPDLKRDFGHWQTLSPAKAAALGLV